MKKIRNVLASLMAVVGIGASGAVTPGEWNSNFTDSLAYATEKNVPIVVIWGNTGCSYCNKLHAVLEDDAIMDWAEDHPILMVSKHEKASSKDADNLAAKAWIKSLNSELYQFPFVGVYWKKADGTVVCATGFTGREGTMPSTTPKGDLAKQFANSLDKLVGSYEPGEEPTGNASFVTADTEDDRLEAEPSTRIVYVPLKRESTRRAAVNTLRIAYPMGTGPSISVDWAAGEATKNVAVEMPIANFQVGRSVSLLLENEDGTELGRSSILLVAAQENSPKNPYWIGEHTAASLPYGEWTMDFDTAKEKVSRFGGKLMVMFGGPLWCPNCTAIEDYVFAEPEFKAWAKANKLVLVHFDQGQASSPSTPEGTPRGRLLTLTQSTKGKSGASYISRHGIEPGSDAVNEVIDRVTYLTDAWLAPETTAARLANPVVLLLNDSGTKVDARFQRQSEGYTMDLAENMCRFKDLLLLAGADENEGYRTVTPLEAEIGEEVTSSLQVNASRKYYRISGLDAGYGIEVTANAARDVTLSLYAGSELLASGCGSVAVTDSLTSSQTEELFVCVSAYDKAQSTFFGPDTTFAFSVTARAVEAESMPFTAFTKKQLMVMNPMLFKSRKATIPMFEDGVDTVRLVGMLSVTITSANKITAKFKDTKTTSFSGTWQEISPSTGLVTAELSTKKGAGLALSMNADGYIEAKYESESGLIASGNAGIEDMSDYQGRYTVTLVDVNGTAGTGSLSVNVTKAGKATVKGTMPDGTTVSVSAELSPNGDGTALLPLYASSSKGTLSAVLSIDADAEDTWGEEGMTDTVRSLSGCTATWTTTAGEVAFDVFGGYWESATPLEICDHYELSNVLNVVIGSETNDVVTATKNGFKVTKSYLTSLSFTKSTGVFSGKAKVVNSLGKTVTATIKGVLLPGWIDCGCIEGKVVIERPYGSGTLYYKSGSVVVSCPIDLVATEK